MATASRQQARREADDFHTTIPRVERSVEHDTPLRYDGPISFARQSQLPKIPPFDPTLAKMERIGELIEQIPDPAAKAFASQRFHSGAGIARKLTSADIANIPTNGDKRTYDAMVKICKLLEPLDRDAQIRILQSAKSTGDVSDLAAQVQEHDPRFRARYLEKLQSTTTEEFASVQRQLRAARDMQELERAPRLERIAATQLHDLFRAAGPPNEVIAPLGREGIEVLLDYRHTGWGTLAIEHDWTSAFANASGDDIGAGEVRLPFETTLFELRVCGMHIIAGVMNDTIDGRMAIFGRNKDGWFFFGGTRYEPSGNRWVFEGGDAKWVAAAEANNIQGPWTSKFARFIARQARCIAVALDAEVATREVVRADYKLNRERERKGKLPIYDYHVVRLAHQRTRAAPLPAEMPHPRDHNRPITRKRLHFRRGHWRHFPSHKTWIRWQLVGSPDIGFVDKEYRI